MALRDPTQPAKRTAYHSKYTDRGDLAQLWADVRICGVGVMAHARGVTPSTIYLACQRVEKDPELLAEARVCYAKAKDAIQTAAIEAHTAGLRRLQSELIADKPEHLSELVAAVAALSRITGTHLGDAAAHKAAGSGTTGATLSIPVLLTHQRPDRPAGDATAPPAPLNPDSDMDAPDDETP